MQDRDGRLESGQGLAESEEKYRLISEVISDYTFSTKLNAEGRLFLNWVAGAFETITGYTYEEYVARGGWLAALHPDDVEQDARDMEALHQNRAVVTELRTFTKSGELRWVRVYGHPVWDPARQQLVGIYGAVQDITERKQAEAEREALIRELEAKNAELERFAYTVSHDLKSPLITIRGFLGFVEQDAAAGNLERVRSDLGRIGDAVEKMQRLLNELLELSRVGRVIGPRQRVPLAPLVREAAQRVAGVESVEVILAPELPVVEGDRVRLLEVFENLLANAVKFMGGQAAPRIEVGVRPGAEPVVYVADNGVGIAPAFHQKVFGLFERLDHGIEGTGVGLAIVKRIVEFHGGRIWVESDGVPGQGSRFCLVLPGPSAGDARRP